VPSTPSPGQRAPAAFCESAGDADVAIAAHLAALASTEGRSGRASLRKEQGSHYTPPGLVAWILDRALAGNPTPRTVLDPACGAGNFLVAAAERLIAAGIPAADVLSARIAGIDLDGNAVQLCRARLRALLPADASPADRARVDAGLAAHVVVADAFAQPLAQAVGCDAVDVIVGNPPFLNQLEVATAVTRADAAAMRERTGGIVGGYADVAVAFLVDACRSVSERGSVGFVMPQSFLASKDARAAREWISASMRPSAIWTADERLFDGASVRVAGIVVERGPGLAGGPRFSKPVRRAFGPDFAEKSAIPAARLASGEPWAALFADLRGVPEIVVGSGATIGSVATATADFRDQFYGLRGAILDRREADDARYPRLVTTRHVDLACCAWGWRPVKLLGARLDAPRADGAALAESGAMQTWMHARLVPKVLVATQTRVMEAVVDERGAWLPVVPLISATLRDDARADGVDLWMLAAAIASPVVAAKAARLSYGAALSAHAIKLSAKQLLAMPLPSDRDAWQESAALFRDASHASDHGAREGLLRRFAESSCRAHRLDAAPGADLLRFWCDRAFGGAEEARGSGKNNSARRSGRHRAE